MELFAVDSLSCRLIPVSPIVAVDKSKADLSLRRLYAGPDLITRMHEERLPLLIVTASLMAMTLVGVAVASPL